MKHTIGKVSISESGNPAFDLCIVAKDGGSICHISNWPEHKENAELISEAFNVTHETGKTPRQLADYNKELLEACKALLASIANGMDVMKSMDMASEAIKNATK